VAAPFAAGGFSALAGHPKQDVPSLAVSNLSAQVIHTVADDYTVQFTMAFAVHPVAPELRWNLSLHLAHLSSLTVAQFAIVAVAGHYLVASK